MPRYSISKQITRQLQAADRVITSAGGLAEKIAAELERKFGRGGEPGEPQIDWVLFQNVLGEVLKDSAARLRQVDDAHAEVEVASQVLRTRRDEAAGRVKAELRRVRFYFDETLTKQEARELFPQRRYITTLDPANLARLGKHLAGLLRGSLGLQGRAPAANLPTPEALAQSLEAATQELDTVLVELSPGLLRAKVSFDTKVKESKEALDTWRSTRDLLDRLYRVAGFGYLADELRERRRRKADEEGEGAAMTGGAQPPTPTPAAAPAAEVPAS